VTEKPFQSSYHNAKYREADRSILNPRPGGVDDLKRRIFN
jgi:hypothetical protein